MIIVVGSEASPYAYVIEDAVATEDRIVQRTSYKSRQGRCVDRDSRHGVKVLLLPKTLK